MKKGNKFFIAVVILVLASASLSAQVTFRMKRPPLNQLKATDLWNATIINTGEPFTAYLYGSMTNNENGELIATGQTMTFEVKKGTTNFKISDLSIIPDVSYLAKDPKYKQSFMNTGGAPPGDYKICCELRRKDNTVAGEDCFTQKITGGDAPQLVSPRDEEELKIDNPVFTWMHIKSAGSNQTYTLRIVEIKGEQSPDEAMKRNNAFFEKEGISSTLFQYPASAPKFEAGKKYAWLVKIGDLQSTLNLFDKKGISGTPVVTSLSPFCTDFESGGGGWQVNNAGMTIKPSGGNPGKYVETTDQSGPSFLFNTDSSYTGNWGDLMTDSCGSLCFDVSFIYRGNIYNGTNPPSTMHPAITIEGSGFVASFVSWNLISEGDGWHTYCAPLKYLNADGTLPSNSDGYWVMGTGSTPADWNSLLGNVTKVRLTCDPSSFQAERIGYDNICIKNTGDCIPVVVGNVCDSFNVVPFNNAGPVGGDCCWSLNLTHPSSTANMTGIQFSVLTPNTFVTGSSNLGSAYNSGWIYTANTPQEFTIKRLSGSIPTGQLNGFFNFCLNKLSSPQHVVVNWLKNDNSIVCSDTVNLNCDIPCVTIGNDTLLCSGGNYNLNFSFTNNSLFPVNKIEVVNTVPAGITVSTPVITLFNPVNSGQTSNLITNSISGLMPDSSVCIVLKFTSPDGCCWCYDTLCVTAPSCVCNEIDANITGDLLNCCFSLNLTNNYSGNYFTQINLTTLESGVAFSTWNTNTSNNWYSTNTYPDNRINLINNPSNYPNNYVPSGNLSNIVNFCLTNYTTTTQHVLVEWVGKDSVKCVDTLVIHCVPPPPVTPCVQLINDSLTCLPDGTFKYTFHIKNNSSHITTGFQFNPVSPSTLVFTPANFSNVTIAPNMISPQQTLIISGVSPGSQFCFNISLYEHTLISGQQYYDWCCYSTEICKTLPVCGIINNDSCKCGQWLEPWPDLSEQIKLTSGNTTYYVDCNYNLPAPLGPLPAGNQIKFEASYQCNPYQCNPVYDWYLINTSNSQTISSGTNVSMPIYFTPPSNIETKYQFIVIPKCGGSNCDSCGFYFTTVEKSDCDCNKNKWKSNSVIEYSDGKVNSKKEIKCLDEEFYGPVLAGTNVTYSASPYVCTPENCAVSYKWRIIDLSSNAVVNSGTSAVLPVIFPAPNEGKYRFTVVANCGGKNCDSCGFNFYTEGKSDCGCGGWADDKKGFTIHGFNGNVTAEIEEFLPCGETYSGIIQGVTLDFVSQLYKCVSKENCNASYNWLITSPSGTQSTFNTVSFNNFQFNEIGIYKINLKVICNGKVCDECVSYIKVEKPPNPTGCNCGSNTYGGFIMFDNFKINCGTSPANTIFYPGNHTIVGPAFTCSASGNCQPVYSYTLIRNGVTVWTGSNGYHQFAANFTTTGNSNSTYTIKFSVSCGGVECGSCSTTVIIGNNTN